MAKSNQGSDPTQPEGQNDTMQEIPETRQQQGDDGFAEVGEGGPKPAETGSKKKTEEEAMIQMPVSQMKEMMERMKSLEDVVLKGGTKASNAVRNDWQELDESKRVRFAKVAIYHELEGDEGALIIDRQKLREVRDDKGRAKDSEYLITLLDRAGKKTEKKVTLFQLVAIQQEFTTVSIIRTDKKVVFKKTGETQRGFVTKDSYRTEGEDVKEAVNHRHPQFEFRHKISCLVRTDWGQEIEISADRLNLS